jgi:hypothetical protein
MSCGSVEEPPSNPDTNSPELGDVDPTAGNGDSSRPAFPDKEELDSARHCESWREDIADELSPTAPWGLPPHGTVSENIRGFFAAQHPIDGRDYLPCVLAEIFEEVDLHVETLRTTYFSLPAEQQLARAEIAVFFSFLYVEPSTLPLLVDIAVQPISDFNPDFIESLQDSFVMEGEADVRADAVLAISDTAPRNGDARPWIDALYEVVARCEIGGIPLIATWQLKTHGVTKAEFSEKMQGNIDDEQLSYLLENGW